MREQLLVLERAAEFFRAMVDSINLPRSTINLTEPVPENRRIRVEDQLDRCLGHLPAAASDHWVWTDVRDLLEACRSGQLQWQDVQDSGLNVSIGLRQVVEEMRSGASEPYRHAPRSATIRAQIDRHVEHEG